jgi:hypothetical protein
VSCWCGPCYSLTSPQSAFSYKIDDKLVIIQVGCRLGEEVGYAIRFEDCTGPETVIKCARNLLCLTRLPACHRHTKSC